MAIQRVDGYVYSCGACGAVYPRRRRRGDALQDEIDHHRIVEKKICDCLVIKDHQHHRTDCVWSHRPPVEAPSEPESPAGPS